MQIEFHLLEQMQSLNPHSDLHFRLYGRYLEKSIWRHNSAADRLITAEFGSKMQNVMPMTTHTSKLKLEVQFKYGGRPISETGSSFISAVD